MLGTVSHAGIEYREIYRFANTIIEKDAHERWDIEHILHEIIKGLNQAVDIAGRGIASIGVDAWGVDFAMLDASGKLMELPVAYRDKRTAGMEEKWLGMMSREETFQRSGINFYIFNTLFQLLPAMLRVIQIRRKGGQRTDHLIHLTVAECFIGEMGPGDHGASGNFIRYNG
jgi:rhamnulokinase